MGVDDERAALETVRDIARRLVSGQEDPLCGAYRVYAVAAQSGASGQDTAGHGDLAHYGAIFIQLADVLERQQDSARVRQQVEDLIRDTARALLVDSPMPEWWLDACGELHRGTPPGKRIGHR